MKCNNIRRANRSFSSIIILMCMLFLLGCNSSSTKTLSGKYVDEVNPQNFTEFKADGTFTVQKNNNNISGSYTTDGHILTLKLKSGEIFKGKIEGNSIIGDGGGRSTKK